MSKSEDWLFWKIGTDKFSFIDCDSVKRGNSIYSFLLISSMIDEAGTKEMRVFEGLFSELESLG